MKHDKQVDTQTQDELEKLQHQLVEMEVKARDAAENAYCPHSNFYVGCAVLGDNQKVYAGCNVDNAAYASTICAESNAIGNAITNGVKEIKAMLIYTPTDVHTYPCGNCRQILNEISGDIPVYSVCNSTEVKKSSLAKLLPDAYGPINLYSSQEGFGK